LEVAEDDAALIEASWTNPAAFALLYKRYYPYICNYVRLRLPTLEDAEDITQQVFVRLYERRWSYRVTNGSFSGWLFHTARNLMTDHHRKQRPTIALQVLAEFVHPLDPSDLEAEHIYRADLVRLATCLHKLTAEKQEILTLRYGGRLGIPAIARALGKSPAAVEKILHRTLKELRHDYGR